jgi:hypothetical protein
VSPGPRWKSGTRRRYRYYDGTGSAAGVRKLVLQAGSTGEAKVRVRARGVNVDFPALPLAPPLRVQLVGDDGGGLECWEAQFATLGTNTEIKVEAEQWQAGLWSETEPQLCSVGECRKNRTARV